MKNLFTYLKALWGAWGNLLSNDVSFDCRLTVGSPSFDCRSAMLKLVSVLVLILTVGVGNVWGETGAITISSEIIIPAGSTSNITKTYWSTAGAPSYSTSNDVVKTITISSTNIGSLRFYHAGYDSDASKWCGLASGGGYLETVITSTAGVDVVVYCKRGGSKTGDVTVTLTGGTTRTTTGTSWATLSTGTTSTKATLKIENGANNQGIIGYIQITPKAASCTTNASVTDGSNSSVTKNSARVTCSSGISSLGSAGCSISSYGFVLGTSSNPTTSNTTYEVGKSYTSTGVSFYKDITGLSAGTTYYVRPYATNGNGTAYGTQTTFTTLFEASITLNKNTSDAGSTAGSAKAVENATSLSSITAPTRTGYNLEGYYTTSECATKIATSAGAFQPSITVSSNTWTNGSNQWKRNASETFYAKWTAKTTTVSFNQTSGTGGQTGTLTATYGSAMPSAPVTCPTRTGYDFGGYYDGSGGTGTQYYTSTGASARTWNKEDATYTLHAKWTIKNYTITWKVNGETWSDKGGSTNANYNTAWSSLTLPTAPDPENDGCGQKFVGWTTTENYSNATTAPTDLLNADNKSGKTAVLITDNVVFHAVFADYDE